MRYEGQDTTMFTSPVVDMERFDKEQNRIVQDGYMSIKDAIEKRADGTYRDPLEERVKVEMDRQVEANGYLATIANQGAGKRYEQIEEIIQLLRDLPNRIKEVNPQEEARRNAGRYDSNPDVVILNQNIDSLNAKRQAEIDRAKSVRDTDKNFPNSSVSQGADERYEKKVAEINARYDATIKPFEVTLNTLLTELRKRESEPSPESTAKLNEFLNNLKEIETLSGGGLQDQMSAKSKLEELKRQYDTQFGLPSEAKGDFGYDVNLAKTQAEAIAKDIEKRQSPQNNQTSSQTQPNPIDNTVVTLDNLGPIPVVLANMQDMSAISPGLDLNNNGCCNEIVAAVTSLKETMMSSMGNIGTDIGFEVVEAIKTIQVPLRLETQSQNFLDNFNNKFNSYVSRLEQAAQEIPEFITLVGKHTVDVNIRGADVLQVIEPRIQDIVANSIDVELQRYTQANGMPPATRRGRQTGGGGRANT